MNKQEELVINGQVIPEGYFLNNWFASRFDANKNVLLVVVGATGSGKSYSCIGMAESWYKYRFKNKEFPLENIVFSLGEGARRLKGETLEKGEFIIVEEAGVVANALDFQNKLVRLFNYILQSVRCKNIGIIFNLPNFSLLNKTGRSLAHGVFETVGINKNTNQVLLKSKGLQTNAITGKIYPKYLRQVINGKLIAPRRIKVGKPSDRIIIPYEKMKSDFVEKQISGLIDETTPQEEKQEKKKEIKPIWKAIKLCLDRGITNQFEIGKIIGISQPKVSRHLQLMEENGFYEPKYLEKVEKYTSNPLLAPISI